MLWWERIRTITGGRVFAWGLLPLCLLASVWLSTPLIEHNSGLDSDGVLYAAMAEKTAEGEALSRTAPWCWRPLTPFLASLLPYSTITDFKVLAFFSSWLSLVLLYEIIRRCNLSHVAAILGMLFYAGIFWTVKFSFYSPCYIDVQTQAFLLAVMLLMVAGRHWVLPVLIGAGTFQKESMLFLTAVAYLHYARGHRRPVWRLLAYLMALGLPAVAAFLAVRLAVDPVNHYSSLDAFLINLARATKPDFWPRLLLATFSGLGMLPLIVCYRARYSYQFLRENPEWLAMIVVGLVLLFGGVDKARLFLYVLPPLVLMASGIFEEMLVRSSRATWVWIGTTLLLHLHIGHQFAAMGTYQDYLNRMVPFHAPGPLLPSFGRLGMVVVIWLGVTLAMVRAAAVAKRRNAHSV